MGENMQFLARPLRLSDLVVDADLDLGVRNLRAAQVIASQVNTDALDEKTPGHNITAAKPLTTSTAEIIADVVQVDQILEKSPTHGIQASRWIRQYTAGDSLIVSLGTGYAASTTDVLQKTVKFIAEASGSVRVKASASAGGGRIAYITLKQNEVQVGSVASGSGSWDVTLAGGDTLTLYLRSSEAGTGFAASMGSSTVCGAVTYKKSTAETAIKAGVSQEITVT